MVSVRDARAALAALALAACSSGQTGIVLEVATELRIPDQMDALSVRVRSGDRTLMMHTYELGEPPKLRLPAKLGLQRQGDGDGPISIELAARRRSQLMVSRNLRVKFLPGEVREVKVDLDLECLGVICPSTDTCVPQRGCVDPDLDAPVPTTNTPCDCDSYFPLCVGATWTYAQTGPNNLDGVKTWLIQAEAAIGGEYGKAGLHGFVQFRQLDGGVARRWLRVDGTPGDQRVFWEKDEFFSNTGSLAQTTYYVPNKLRFDDSHRLLNQPWPLMYQQIDLRPGVPNPDALAFDEKWEVVPAETQVNFPKLTFKEALCQRRSATDSNGFTWPAQTYCFVKGVGKVYERTAGGDEEILVSYAVPRCGSLGRE
jgi:hypothetical protein